MQLELRNAHIRLAFDVQTRQLTSLMNLHTGDDYLKGSITAPLFKLFCLLENGKSKIECLPGVLEAAAVSERQDGQVMVIKFSDVHAEGVAHPLVVCVEIFLGKDEAELEWKLILQNDSREVDVVEVLFPYLRGVVLGDSWEDDTILYPQHAGEKTLAPVREYTSERFMSFWRSKTHQTPEGWWREINYCGLASMQWMYYYDAENGLYLGSHDDCFGVTGLRVETGGPGDPWMGFAFRKHHRIRPQERWESRPFVIAVNEKDWHWGARRYRRWIDDYLEIQPYPEYLDDEFSLNKLYNLKRVGKVIQRYDCIPGIFDRGRETFKARHMFIASWNRGGFDWGYPEYQPDMELGSPLDLARAVRYVNQRGGHVTFYINARIFDMGSDYFETLGRRWAIQKENGEFYIESYDGPRRFTATCPAHPDWQHYFMDIACWMVEAYGAAGIYLDQLGSAEPFACYAQDHSHANIEGFNQGYLHMVKELNRRLKELNPNSYLMIENCGDIYSAYVWGNLSWNGDPYDEFFNLFRYTFPEYPQVHMVNPRPGPTPAARKERFYKDMQRATLLGMIYWLGFERFKDDDGELWSYMEKVVAYRAGLLPLLKCATFLDTDGILRISDQLRATHWQTAGGDDLYLLGNMNEAEGESIDLPLTQRNETVSKAAGLSGEEIRLQVLKQQDSIRVYAPAQKLSHFLIRKTG